jgi:hypothetical protein
MLFDLRSRGRRTTVRIIYLLLALVMLSGLILVGVGTGNNNGGLLNAFTNNGSGSSGGQSKAILNQTRKALKATTANPKSPGAWAKLVQARWSEAGSGNNYNTTTEAYTASGKKQLKLALAAWDKYLPLTNDKPSINVSTLAARAGVIVADWPTSSNAWQYVVSGEAGSSSAQAFLCLAFTSYASGNSRTGDLASAKVVTVAPKLQRLQLKQELKAAKKTKTTAEEYATEEC